MHSKTKGSIGQLSVAVDLLSKGYEVFTELGDNSRIDLIAVDRNYDLIKIQVKCLTPKDGSIRLKPTKSGPCEYRFRYSREHADVYAVLVQDVNMILYVAADELLNNKDQLNIRITDAKNNQRKKIRDWRQYSEFEKALRGHTRDILTDLSEG